MRIALVGAELEENLALRYIWAALQSAGHTVLQIVFNSPEDLDFAAHELARSRTELAGFSMVFTYRAREFADLAARARQLGYRGHIVAGGHFAAFNAEALLRHEPAFNSVAIGEGEQILCALAEHLNDLAAVNGLVWRSSSPQIVRNAPATKPPDLDTLAYPVRKNPPHQYLGLPIANMLASRGCTHACAFCSIAAWHQLCGGERFRLRSPQYVAAEMSELYARGYRIFNFHDDNFFLQDTPTTFKRVRELEHELRRRGVGKIAFAVKARPDNVDAELFAFLKELGMFRVFLGIEAGTAEALKTLGRGQTLAQNERALEIVHSLDLHCCYNLLLLNPDSTLEDLCRNIEFLSAHPHSPMNFCRTEVYSGTPLEQKLRSSGRLHGSYWGYGYKIQDPRAQLAFELMHTALFARHHGADNLQHLAMAVDYEHQLAAHFFGPNPKLRRRVKDFITAVNSDACSLLSQIAAAAAQGFSSPSQQQRFVMELQACAEKDGQPLRCAAETLLQCVHAMEPTGSSRQRHRWSQEAAAVALSATLLAAGRGTAAEERVPEAFEMIARPALEADAAEVMPQFLKEVLPGLALQLEKPVALNVTLVLAADGSLESCDATTPKRAVVSFVPVTPIKFRSSADRRNCRFNVTEKQAAEARKHVYEAPAGPVPPIAVQIPSQLQQQLLALALHIRPAIDVELELWFGKDGSVRYVGIFRAGARLAKELSAEDKKTAERALAELGHEDFATREQASATLLQLGTGVTPPVKETLARSDDPEVKTRCAQLLTALDPALTGPGAAQILSGLRGMSNVALAERRIILALKKEQLEQAFKEWEEEEGTHMHEMAPAPRD